MLHRIYSKCGNGTREQRAALLPVRCGRLRVSGVVRHTGIEKNNNQTKGYEGKGIDCDKLRRNVTNNIAAGKENSV